MRLSFIKRAKILFWSIIKFFQAIHCNGFAVTCKKVDQITEQSAFWYPRILEIKAEMDAAVERGDIENVTRLHVQFFAAIRRFEEEVARPLENLAK